MITACVKRWANATSEVRMLVAALVTCMIAMGAATLGHA